jgi:coenzyme Q-binding protein COQ10
VIVADMEVGYKAIHERFTSRVTLDRAASRILVEYIDGPFSFLENKWTFSPDTTRGPHGAAVEFYINYEFRNRMLAMLAGAVFDHIFRMFSEAFEGRADSLHGRPGASARAAG